VIKNFDDLQRAMRTVSQTDFEKFWEGRVDTNDLQLFAKGCKMTMPINERALYVGMQVGLLLGEELGKEKLGG
jgi:hypothetical protein